MGALCCCLNEALDVSSKYLETDSYVSIYFNETDDIIFDPINANKKSNPIGVIIFPDLKQDPRGYSEIAYSLAVSGFFTIVCKTFCYVPPFSPNKAKYLIEKYSSKAEKWVIGGHAIGKTKIKNAKNNCL